jgi:type III secretion inner rod protein HrpB2
MNIVSPVVQLTTPPPVAGGPDSLQPPLPAVMPQVDAPLAARFSELMTHSRMVAAQPPGADSGSLISEMLRSEDVALQYVSNDMLFMLEHANGMTMGQLTTASMQVQIEAASLQVDMQAKMSVVTSSKDAIETLMKNQ